MSIFSDEIGFSWRKFSTAVILAIFSFYCIFIAVTNPLTDIPTRIAIIFGMVFTFYFGKNSVKEVSKLIKNVGDKKDD